MYRLFVIAKNNMKKQKGDMFTFFILTFIAAFLIFDCASAILGLGRVLDDRFKAIGGAHAIILSHDTEAEKDSAQRAFQENANIIDYEKTPMLQFTTEYRKKGDQEYSSFMFIAENAAEDKRIMKVNDAGMTCGKDEILIPYNLSGRFCVGDVMQLKFGDDEYDLRVAGFLEDPYFCSTTNVTIYYIGLHQEFIDALVADHPADVMKGYAHKGVMDESKLSKDYGTTELEQEITSKYKDYLSEYSAKNPEANYSNYMAVNWQMMRGGSEFIPLIVMAILLLFAVMVLVISLVIISFSIKNFIQRNMKNTGILEASGYTVKELRASLILQILIIAAIGSLVGIGIAVLTFKQFGNVVGAVLGLRWNQPVNGIAAACTVLGTLLVIGLVSLWLSSAYKKITVLDALRGGISTHNFKKNYFTFENTPLPIPMVLALKDTFGGLGRNLIMVFISAILVIATLIGFGMVEKFAKNTDGMMGMMAFEMATDEIVATGCNKDLSEDLRGLEDVENVLVDFGFEPTINMDGRQTAMYTHVVDDLNHTRSTNMLEGRYPEKENEILVTMGIANDLQLKVGDVIELEFAGKKADYIITGINQRMERMGRTIYMRIDGAKKIFPGEVIGAYRYLVTAKDGISYEQLKSTLNEYAEREGLEFQHTDMYTSMNSTIATITMAVKVICIVIAVLTIVIVIFVESLVIRAKIAREWRGMGISKALGQTSGGLICQIMLSNLPAILTGAILGGLLSPFAGDNMIKAAFSLFAMKKVCFSIPLYYVILTIAGIVIVAVLTSATAGLKVRKLKAIDMITEE
ncbi:MAG: hypothetical protein II477_09480 [Lachnospiraceae bacterium]|nr:hypothetical protein [Lachnospiraceae bacterium]